jgi:hypothetical protein
MVRRSIATSSGCRAAMALARRRFFRSSMVCSLSVHLRRRFRETLCLTVHPLQRAPFACTVLHAPLHRACHLRAKRYQVALWRGLRPTPANGLCRSGHNRRGHALARQSSVNPVPPASAKLWLENNHIQTCQPLALEADRPIVEGGGPVGEWHIVRLFRISSFAGDRPAAG